MEDRLMKITQELKNIEYGDENYKSIEEELKKYSIAILQLSEEEAERLINKYINKDKKAFDNFFEQYPHGLIDIAQQLIEKLKE